MTHIVLRSENEYGESKTVIVEADTYKNDESPPADYFSPAFAAKAKRVGEVDIDDPDNLLSYVYESTD